MASYEVFKYSPELTGKLADLRRERDPKINQTEAGEFFGVGRRAISEWENGTRKPNEKRRARFIVYLVDKLGLRTDYHRFKTLWEELMVGEWKWEPLSDEEWRHAFPGHLPPILKIPLQRPPRAEPFIGREKELKQLLKALQPGQVVTLCGPGGIGKTAIAAKAIWTLAPDNDPPDRFPDGIIFHSFYKQPQADLALEKIALAFGEEPRPTPRDAAQRALAGRQALLILDGTEAADNLPAVLEVRGQCGVIVTSRHRKDAVFSDDRLDIPPLPMTEATAFLQTFVGEQDKNKTAVEEICQLVDGLPLAISIVGGYMFQTGETVTEYLETLKQTRLPELRGAQRQSESIPILLERSLSRVSRSTRQVLAVIGLLAPTSFTIEAIIASLEMSTTVARTSLGELVSYNLLLRLEQRYQVAHALLHAYVQENLIPPGEVVSRLASHYIRLVEKQSALKPEGYTTLDIERPHLTEVLRSCQNRAFWEQVQHLAQTFQEYLNIQCHWTDLITVAEAGREAAEKLGHLKNQALFLNTLGKVAGNIGQYEQAQDSSEQALIIAREVEDYEEICRALKNLGDVYYRFGQTKQSKKFIEEGLAIAQLHAPKHASVLLNTLGLVAEISGEYQQAEQHYLKSLEYAEKYQDDEQICITLQDLGILEFNRGDYTQAEKYLLESLRITRKLRDKRKESFALITLGAVMFNRGRYGEAEKHFQEALTISRNINHSENISTLLTNLGDVSLQRGNYKQAENYLQEGLALARKIGHQINMSYLLVTLGALENKRGNNQAADRYLREGLTLTSEEHREITCILLRELGITAINDGLLEQAQEYLQEGLALAREIEHQEHLSYLLQVLSEIACIYGHFEQAQEYLQEGLSLAREIEAPWLISNAQNKWGELYLNRQEISLASTSFSEALEIARKIDCPELIAEAQYGLGRVLAFQHRPKQARSWGEESLSIFSRLGHQKVTRVSTWLNTID